MFGLLSVAAAGETNENKVRKGNKSRLESNGSSGYGSLIFDCRSQVVSAASTLLQYC